MKEELVDRKLVWDKYLYLYLCKSKLKFSKAIVRYLERIYLGETEVDLSDKNGLVLLNMGNAPLIFNCLPKQRKESWCVFFQQFEGWLDMRFPASKGVLFLEARNRHLKNFAAGIDPAQCTFKTWQYGWSDVEDIEYYDFWYGDVPSNLSLNIPENWKITFSRDLETHFIDLCYGLNSYLRGEHTINSRFSIVYTRFKEILSTFDSEIFLPTSYLGEGKQSDVKTALASLLYTTHQREEVVESFNEYHAGNSKYNLPRYPCEITSFKDGDIWNFPELKAMRDLIHTDLQSNQFPDAVRKLSHCVSYPNISLHATITVPTEKIDVQFHDPWNSAEQYIYLRGY